MREPFVRSTRFVTDDVTAARPATNVPPVSMLGLLDVLAGFLAIGVVVGPLFVVFASRLEPTAVGGSLGFRLAILPGAVVLWPLIAARALGARLPGHRIRPQRRAHLVVFSVLALVLGSALGYALHRRSVVHAAFAGEAP